MTYEIIIGRNKEDLAVFGKEGTIYIGKQYVQMGQTVSLSNKVFLDVNRPHVIMVTGKRGCLIGDTFVFTDSGYKQIKDFEEGKDLIYSFNIRANKLELEKSRLFKYWVNEELIFIKLRDGQDLIATIEHPFLVKSNKEYSWKLAEELTTEDKIVSVVQVPKSKVRGGISKKMARLMGFILADGTLSIRNGRFKDGRGYWYNGKKARLRIFNAEEEVLNKAREDLEEEFKIKAKRYNRRDCNCEVIETKHQKIINKFVRLGIPLGKKSSIIRVPRSIFAAHKNIQAQFLKALFSCDGTISKGGKDIEYYSNSLGFLKDLQLVLNHFGIHGKVREKRVKCNGKQFLSYALYICDYESIKNFEEEIGFFSDKKMNRLKDRKFYRMNRRKNTEYISNDLFFEDIVGVFKRAYKGYVYDLRVPKNHSFIANGIISHNSGKSYFLSVMAEEIIKLEGNIKKNLSFLFFDTMGIFWTMKFPNTRQENLLEEWEMIPEKFDVNIFTPKGFFKDYKKRGISNNSFSMRTSELDASDWINVFNLNITDAEGILVSKIIESLQGDYSIGDIIRTIQQDKKAEQKAKDSLENRFLAAEKWGLFDEYGTELKNLIKAGEASIVDVSCYTDANVKALVIGLISRKLLNERISLRKYEELQEMQGAVEKEQEGMPLIWILVDEAHDFLPRNGKTPATDALIQILREGRQPGISLVLATQQPGEIHKDVLTQSDVVISHRLTAKADIEALNSMMQSYLVADLQRYLNELPRLRGSAIVLDDNSERIYPLRVHPKRSWHGGEAPKAIRGIKKEETFVEDNF